MFGIPAAGTLLMNGWLQSGCKEEDHTHTHMHTVHTHTYIQNKGVNWHIHFRFQSQDRKLHQLWEMGQCGLWFGFSKDFFFLFIFFGSHEGPNQVWHAPCAHLKLCLLIAFFERRLNQAADIGAVIGFCNNFKCSLDSKCHGAALGYVQRDF